MFTLAKRFTFVYLFMVCSLLFGDAFFDRIVFRKRVDLRVEKQRLADENFIRQCGERLDVDSPLLKNAVECLKRLIPNSPNAAVVYARHLREHEERYLDALLTVSQHILPAQLHLEWENAQTEKLKTLISIWQRNIKEAKRKGGSIPERPFSDLLCVPFPEVSFWRFSPNNFESVCEAACALESLGQKEIIPAVQKHLSRMKNISEFNVELLNTEFFIMNGRYSDALKSLLFAENEARREWVNHPQLLKRKLESYALKRKRIQALSKIPPKILGYTPDHTPNNQRLLELEHQIHEELLTVADFSWLKEQIRWGETLRHRARAAVLTARAIRLANQDAKEAFKILMPLVTKGSEFAGDALPEWYGFTVNAGNGCVIPELVRTLTALNRHQEAITLCERFRESLSNIDRIETECAQVEVHFSIEKLKEGEKICRDAMKLAEGLHLTRCGQLRKDPTGVIQQLTLKLQQLLAGIHEKQEIQRYGSAFAALRVADSAFSEGELLKAYDHYSTLMCEQSPYGEAAEAHAIQCLLEFSTETGAMCVNQARTVQLKTIETRLKALRSTGGGKLFGVFAKNRASEIKMAETRMTCLNAIPLKREARKLAEQRLEALVRNRKNDLYIGELRLAFALKDWIEDGELSKAKTTLEHSLQSFKNHSNSKYYEDKIYCAPVPASPYIQDLEGYRIPVRVEPGTLLSARTAVWYIHFKKDEVLRLLGLTAFLDGQFETAQTLWSQCNHTERIFRSIPHGGEQRLLSAVKKRKKGLVTPDEGAQAFSGKRRVRFVLAEFFYLNGEWKKSLHILERLKRGNFGLLNKDERGAVALLMAKCKRRMNLKNWSGPHELEAELESLKGIKMESRILFECANMWLMATPPTPNRETMKQLRKPFERVIERSPRSHEAERALFTLGAIHAKFFPYRATVYFKRYVERYPNGKYKHQAREYLNRYE